MNDPVRRSLILVFCLALFTVCGAKAQEPDIPVKMQGVWAAPDCKNVDEALILASGYGFRTDGAANTLWPLPPVTQKRDYWLMQMNGEQNPVRLEADGVLKIISMPKPEKGWPSKWSALHTDEAQEYMGCAETPALLPEPLVRAMKHIDALAAACTGGTGCAENFFKAADENHDGKVSLRELRNAAISLAEITKLTHGTASRDALDKSTFVALREADALSGGRSLTAEDFSRLSSPFLEQTLAEIKYFITGQTP